MDITTAAILAVVATAVLAGVIWIVRDDRKNPAEPKKRDASMTGVDE